MLLEDEIAKSVSEESYLGVYIRCGCKWRGPVCDHA